MLSLPVAAALLVWMTGKKRPSMQVVARRVLLPLLLLLSLMGAAMGYYFWRVTGSPFRMPYQVDRAEYAVAPYFCWQSSNRQPVYRHAAIRDYYLKVELPAYLRTRSIGGFLREACMKIAMVWGFYIGPALTVPLLALPWVLRDRRIRWLAITGAVCIVGMTVVAWLIPHYAAPLTAVILAVILQGMRHLRAWRWEGKPSGLFLTRAVTLICVLMVAVNVLMLTTRKRADGLSAFGAVRAGVLKHLDSLPGSQLVLVRYKPGHDTLIEWVYNEADIDRSRVVWARDMGDAENQELIRYFNHHTVWLLEADENPPKLSPYLTSLAPGKRVGTARGHESSLLSAHFSLWSADAFPRQFPFRLPRWDLGS